jgi:hypothetical protein
LPADWAPSAITSSIVNQELLAGLYRLRAEGRDTALLCGDTENPTGALRLYESVGFVETLANVSYGKNLTTSRQ